jgi:hypothetical protein
MPMPKSQEDARFNAARGITGPEARCRYVRPASGGDRALRALRPRKEPMAERLKSWAVSVAASLVALAAGYTLARPGQQGGDLLDAVGAVQRRAPRFLVSEPRPTVNWVQSGCLYLCSTARAAQEVHGRSMCPGRLAPNGAGVACFKGAADPRQFCVPWLEAGGDRCLDHGDFTVFGDPELVQEARAILVAEGFQPARSLP